jgi:SSS family transporter
MQAGDVPSQPLKVVEAGLPAPPFQTSGGFLAAFGDTFVATGVEGGAATLWILSKGAPEWANTGIEVPLYAAAARWGEKWILAGGMRGNEVSADVMVLGMADRKLTRESLPRLPQPSAGAGAAVIQNKLHVFGGADSFEPFQPTRTLFLLDLELPGSGWVEGPAFPGSPRAFFAFTEQYGMFCVFGGLDASGGILSETWCFRPRPLEGTSAVGWRRMADAPVPTVGAAALPVGQAQVIMVEGDHQPGTEAAPGLAIPARAGARPFLFHTLTDAWCALDASLGIAAPLAAKMGNRILVLGGRPDGKSIAEELVLQRTVRNLAWPDYLIIVLYFGLISWIGWFFSRKQESSAEFSLGSRKVLWWAAGISMFATGASAISFMAIPALAFATNLVWLFPLLAMIPGYFVTAHFIYPMLRRMEITSTYEYLERRFNRTLRIIASIQCIIFQTFARAAVVLVLPSLAIASMTGINVYLSVVIMGVITTIYTAIGGFDAVIWTEVFQGVLKFLAPLFMIYVCIASLPGGLGEFVQVGREYQKFDFAMFTWDMTLPAVWVLFLSTFLVTTVSSAGDQPIIQRVFSAPLKEVRRVNITFTICGLLIGLISNVVGIAIFAYFRAHPDKFDPSAQTDQIVPLFVAQAMPVGMAGVVVAAIFASAMATTASAMNSVATIFTEDFYMKMRPGASDHERLATLRLTSYVVGAVGTVMALVLAAQDLKSMMVIWNQMVALIGGGIVGVYTLGMFSRRANGFGAICGAIGSVLITAAVKLFTPLHWGTYMPIAILSCVLLGYLMSWMGRPRDDLAGLTVFTPARRTE